ncbi:MAG: hypothetical protein ABH818_00310 [Patescibacteria group bacterium]|nr:hypothetical protein [Patescibacteria group bacterium]MBU1870870.1 hypothetical protein [Patescibacteria group bacterium]
MLDFQQTVNLKEKMEQQKKESQRRALRQNEEIYFQSPEESVKKELQTINRPLASEHKLDFKLIRLIVFILAFLVVGFTVYSLFFKHSSIVKDTTTQEGWYAVKLVNNEIFYGQIKDIKVDPIIMTNVYYNYDQEKDKQKQINESGNLRLVKRGKETHGPAGDMSLVRSQVLFMEPLKLDSKVLKVILEYEKN